MGNPNAFLGPQDWAQMTHIGTESTGEGLLDQSDLAVVKIADI